MDTGFQLFGTALSSNTFEDPREVNRVGEVETASSVPYFPNLSDIKRKRSEVERSKSPKDGFSLFLGVGHSPSFSDSKNSSATFSAATSSAIEMEESSVHPSLNLNLNLGNEKNYITKNSVIETGKAPESKMHMFDLNLFPSVEPIESSITSVNLSSPMDQTNLENPFAVIAAAHVDNDSTSSDWKQGDCFFPDITNPVSVVPNLSSSVVDSLQSSVTCSSGLTQQQQRSSSSKKCKFNGCTKGARGASGLCISHGGGRRCQKAGCHKGAEGRTAYCKAHGGGRRCQFLGCTKSAEGRTDHCIAHGGGRRCNQDGCTRAARGKSGLCIRHGGGKRCQKENCTRSAEGLSGLCISHGGGKRCQFPECTKGAQGSTMFCKAHGGGKRCTFLGCTKGAEGSTSFCKAHGGGRRCSFQDGCSKSVHGGTLFCVAHGGGKRCAVPDCTKSARGRTDFCVRHGGGKRCKFEGCGKSAQGSTDFCKAHGGGKRCAWGQPGTEFSGHMTPQCDRFARGRTGLCAAHNGLVQDKCVHGGGTLWPSTIDSSIPDAEGFPGKMKEVVDVEDRNATVERFAVLRSFGPDVYGNHPKFLEQVDHSMGSATVPEGRVHGGGLMAMLAGAGPSAREASYLCYQRKGCE